MPPHSVVCGFGLGRLHGRPGQRERARPDLRTSPARLRLRSRQRRLFLDREDLVFGLSGDQACELVLVDRFTLDQDLADPVELVEVVAQHLQRKLVAVLDNPQHFEKGPVAGPNLRFGAA